MQIYVASSWRNQRQPEVVRVLRENSYEVYDFRNPSSGGRGFHWSDLDPEWEGWNAEQFRANLEHPLARDGFNKDLDALLVSEAVVLVMPCGRSAHLEFGWAIGSGRPGVILLEDGEPELMYKMASFLAISMLEVLAFLSKIQHEVVEVEDRLKP